jgi:tryptophan-rich sensory protein
MVCVPLLLLLGLLSSLLSNSGNQNRWYMLLDKPSVVPPGWVFGLVWSVLYVLMGLALSLILDARSARGRPQALGLFGLQVLLNLAWSPIFFMFHMAHFAVFLLVVILVLASASCILFAKIRVRAAWLLVPYLVWLSFATVLAYRIDQLNPNASHLGKLAGTAHITGSATQTGTGD